MGLELAVAVVAVEAVGDGLSRWAAPQACG